MKIENAGLSQISSHPTDNTGRVEKKAGQSDVQTVRGGQDQALMSGNGRLLAKARVALNGVEDTNMDRISTLQRQIANGEYTVQVKELARKLVERLFPGS